MRELIQLTASAAREVVHLYFDPLRWIKVRLQGRGGHDVDVTRLTQTLAELDELRAEAARQREVLIRTLEKMQQGLSEEHLVEGKSPGSSVDELFERPALLPRRSG